MNRKIIATAVVCILSAVSCVMFMGCENEAANVKFTREEWDSAWETSLEAENYSCKYEYWYADPASQSPASWVYDEVKFQNNKIDYEKKDFKAYVNCRNNTFEAYSFFVQEESETDGALRSELKSYRKWQDDDEWTPEYGCNFLTSGYFVPGDIGEWLVCAGTGNGNYPANYEKYSTSLDAVFSQMISMGIVTVGEIDEMAKRYASIGLPAEMYDYFDYDSHTNTYTATLFSFKRLKENTLTVSFDDGKLKTITVYDGDELLTRATFYDYGTTTVENGFLLN